MIATFILLLLPILGTRNLDDWALIDSWIIFAQLVTIELLQLLANFILIYILKFFLTLKKKEVILCENVRIKVL